jgi:hypothetical protein
MGGHAEDNESVPKGWKHGCTGKFCCCHLQIGRDSRRAKRKFKDEENTLLSEEAHIIKKH